jgi:tetratricopeptide (TPR) repeat protein
MSEKSDQSVEYGGGHPTAEQLADYVEYEWSASAESALWAHLGACIVCRRRLRRAEGWADDPEPPVGTKDYPHVWTPEDPRVRRAFVSTSLQLGAELAQAGSLEAAYDSFYAAAEQALLLPDGEDSVDVADLRFRAFCELAHVHRELNELEEAEEALCDAQDYMAKGSGWAGTSARWHDVAGSLFREQRRFEEAIAALDWAITLYLEIGSKHRATRCRMRLGTVYLAMGKPRRAVRVLGVALRELLEAKPTDHRWLLTTVHNVFLALVEAGEIEGLGDVLRRYRQFYRSHGTPLLRNRRLGLEARVAAGTGLHRRAERLFRFEVAWFKKAGHLYDAALVALSLAKLLVEWGRPSAEVLALLEGAVAAFVNRQLYREMFVSFELLRDAVRAEQGTAEAIAKFTEELSAAARRPQEPQ